MGTTCDRVIEREQNILRVDFRKEPEPPTPKFPGAGALRPTPPLWETIFATSISKMEAA